MLLFLSTDWPNALITFSLLLLEYNLEILCQYFNTVGKLLWNKIWCNQCMEKNWICNFVNRNTWFIFLSPFQSSSFIFGRHCGRTITVIIFSGTSASAIPCRHWIALVRGGEQSKSSHAIAQLDILRKSVDMRSHWWDQSIFYFQSLFRRNLTPPIQT